MPWSVKKPSATDIAPVFRRGQRLSGDVAEWIRLGIEYTELVDVALIPNVRCPMALAPDSPQMQDTITFEDGCGVAKRAVGERQGQGADGESVPVAPR